MGFGSSVPEMVERVGGISVKMDVGYKSYPFSSERVVEWAGV